MTDLSAEFKALAEYRPTHKVRFVTAASLFDGHDAAINIMRRILQGMGAEVIHLGHNRSVDEVVTAALQEDVQGIAYQLLPGRPRRVLQVHGRPAAPARRRAHPGVRRRRRRDRAGGDPRAAGLRRGAHLQPRGRPAHGAAGHDRRDGHALRPRPRRRTRPRPRRASQGHGEAALARAGAADHRAGERQGRRRADASAAGEAPAPQDAGARHHRHRRRRQVDAHRRADPPHAAGPGRRAAHRRHQHRPVAAQERRRAARRPHPHERHRAVAAGCRGSTCARWPRATPAARSAPRCPT